MTVVIYCTLILNIKWALVMFNIKKKKKKENFTFFLTSEDLLLGFCSEVWGLWSYFWLAQPTFEMTFTFLLSFLFFLSRGIILLDTTFGLLFWVRVGVKRLKIHYEVLLRLFCADYRSLRLYPLISCIYCILLIRLLARWIMIIQKANCMLKTAANPLTYKTKMFLPTQ